MSDTDLLRQFYDRRHPEYAGLVHHWAFLEDTYEGGRQWFASNIFRYHKEGDKEFRDRIERAYRFNHTREVVDLLQKYLFKGDVIRDMEKAPEVVKTFWENATLQNLTISQLMRSGSSASSVKGRAAIVVDNNLRQGAISVAEAKRLNMRVYAYVVQAEDLLDYAWDENDGGLLWAKIREKVRDDADPLTSTGDVKYRVRLWTREEWVLYEEEELPNDTKKRGKAKQEVTIKVAEVDRGTHSCGKVPVVFLDHIITDDQYRVPGLIDDIAYLDRAIANYLSNLDAIIQDQTFSQLAMPAQGLLPGDDTYNKLVELSTKRVFVYDGGAGSTSKPEFISPDPKQAQLILTVVTKIINEIYHSIGLAGERTKEDNAVGIDNSSGVAKAYDFERVNSLLMSKGAACEKAENEIATLVCLWSGEKVPDGRLIRYPETYDVMRLMDELSVAEALFKIDAPQEVRREHMRNVIDKLFPRLKADIRTKMLEDIAKWPENVMALEAKVKTPPTAIGGKSPTAPSRQGQVTKKTPA